jgi:tRNA pseudouridine38-40 synthase
MKKAAKILEGTHDFAAFCSTGSSVDSTVRTIYSIDLYLAGDEIWIDVSGDGFLYNMIRIIAGTLIEVGKAKIKPTDLENIIISGNRRKAGFTAPARGLTLLKVFYD